MRPVAADGRPQSRHVAAVGRRRLRPGRNEGGASARLENREGPRRHVAAHGIEHRIAVAHDLGEVGGVVIDDLIGADVAQIGQVGRAGGGDDAGAEMLGKLDGEAGNAARAALDQDRLAGLQLQRVLHRTQSGETGERQSRGVDMRQAAGFFATMDAPMAIFSA